MFTPDDREIEMQPRINSELSLGNLARNQRARSLNVKFKLKNPYPKRMAEKSSNPHYAGYSREFTFTGEDVAVTDNGLSAIIYDTSINNLYKPDTTKYHLTLSYFAKVIITGFNL